MLPVSRPTNYTPATPFKSADALAIFDAIIAGKHNVQEHPVDPSAFRPSLGTPVFDGQKWTGGGGGAFALVAPIPFWVGERLTHVVASYIHGANIGHIVTSVNKVARATWGFTTLKQIDDNVSSAAIFDHDLTPINYTPATTELLQLAISVDATASAAGAEIGGFSFFLDCL